MLARLHLLKAILEQMLELVKLIESNNWDTCSELGNQLDKEEAYECYLEALEWCHNLMDAK